MKTSKITQNEKATPSVPAQQFKKSASVVDHRPIASTQLQRQKLTDQSQQSAQLKQHLGHLNADQHAIAQRQVEEEPAQKKADVTQRVEEEEPAQRAKADEEPLQAKFDIAQRVEEEEPAQRAKLDEEPIQGKFDTVQRIEEEEPAQKKSAEAVNNTGLPNQLKAGIESMSGMSMDHVKVHYNSDKPAQLNAHAYAQGSDIHVAPGQEQHVPHEAWHVVQQAQGRVKPTMQMKMGVPVNDDVGLETEADVMGAKAMQQGTAQLQRYDRVIDIDLTTTTKVWEEQKEVISDNPKKAKSAQSAVSRARGFEIGELRKQYPLPEDYPKPRGPEEAALADKARGDQFLSEYQAILESYEGESDTDGKYAVNKPAIFDGAPERGRNGKIAIPVNRLMKSSPEYIGAHLVKREWGGTDNMWNVVAWTGAAEKKWAAGFERAVDISTAKGEQPGRIQIQVQKEDEALDENVEPKAKELPIVDAKRLELNSALETVPMRAFGANRLTNVDLDAGIIGYSIAFEMARKQLNQVATEAGEDSDSTSVEENRKQKYGERDEERAEHWKREMIAYEGKDKTGKGFNHSNPLVKS